MSDNLKYAFEIMGKGMGSIFAVIILITLIVLLMTKIAEIRAKNKNNSREQE